MSLEQGLKRIEEKKTIILDAERYLWQNPETGYREWKTHNYLKNEFEKLGLEIHSFDSILSSAEINAKDNNKRVFGKIPGFYVDFETGRPGPRIAVFGEMDAIIIPQHSESDPETGAVHACGHHTQCAALLGVAVGLSAPDGLEGLSGSVRLIAVPAEEGIESDFRNSLQKDDVIKYHNGKRELLRRGFMDDVDLAFMIHANTGNMLTCCAGTNGYIRKSCTFVGKSSHAAEPQDGINALNAANLAICAVNALRETFEEKDTVRFHPIITNGGTAVNAVPDTVTVEAYVRAADFNACTKINKMINRAFSAAAAAIGCHLVIKDRCGSSPRRNDKMINDVFADIGRRLLGDDRVDMDRPWGRGCSDFGDITQIIPGSHLYIGGAVGNEHGPDYRIADPVLACVTSAKIQISAIAALLENGAERAKKIISEYSPRFSSVREFLHAVDRIDSEREAVFYNENGDVTLSLNEE